MTLQLRTPRGEDHHNAKLTDTAVRLIRGSKEPTRTLALRYNVSENRIREVRAGTSWRHVK